MAAVPDWKRQLLARRRQEEAAVRGRGKAEQERLAQMPAWKRGLLERRRAKLGLCPGDPSPGPGQAEPGPPEPDESAVLLEAIGPVHQNRFIRQERQQRNEELLAERKHGPPDPRERRPGLGEPRDQNLKGREAREERLSPREARERRLGTGTTQECSSTPLDARDWKQSPGEGGDPNSRLPEARKWRQSPAETPEQKPGRSEVTERRLGPREGGSQNPGPAEVCTWRPSLGEAREQSVVQLEKAEWRLHAGQRGDSGEECGGREESPARWVAPEEISGSPDTPSRKPQDSISRGVETAEQRPSPVEDRGRGLRSTEGWTWTLSSGAAQDWTTRDTDTSGPKPGPLGLAEQLLEPQGVEAGEGEAQEAEKEEQEEGAQSGPPGAPRDSSLTPAPLPPEDAGTGAGPGQQQEEEVAVLQPPPPAAAAPQPSGDPLMNRLFYGVKAGPGVGVPRRSGHTFTVTPRRPVPPASPAPGEATAPGAGKKRYPTAEEILVLGGYLRLSRSCLAKGSPERHHKQLKISFSETALETTYQYPSESSVLEELGPEPEVLVAPSAPAAPLDEEEEEEEDEEPPAGLRGGLRTKALLVDESCRR
ncbi:phostensin [Octodon degus]|uniref:Phostensin n=1 Tax=Octodon degus TaxID=10160 RepID=A0A6P3EHU0_OCTDE|nr:phostensin [Octodon degus]